LRCEVCGRKIREAPMRVIIEGAKLTVCTECSKHGKATWEEPARPTIIAQRQTGAGQGTQVFRPIQIKKKVITARVDTSQEIVQNYAEVIRQARESLGLSTEDLGLKISEKESVLRKIETGKMSPNDQLVSKLEHTLKIKLLVPVAEEKVPLPKSASREFTLGDAMKIDKKEKGEVKTARKPS
jgi:putative transcription factor